MSSIFSGIPSNKWIMNNDLAFAILDIYPASTGHTLFIPKREIKTFFEINNDELKAMKDLINKRKDEILKVYPDISKAKDKINWRPKILFKKGLKVTIDSFK